MERLFTLLIRLALFIMLVTLAGYGAEHVRKNTHQISPAQTYSIKNDIAFVSVWGSRPPSAALTGFEYAVLYNARGEVVDKVEMGKDSVFSLDKMIQENRSRGPLVVKMFRR